MSNDKGKLPNQRVEIPIERSPNLDIIKGNVPKMENPPPPPPPKKEND